MGSWASLLFLNPIALADYAIVLGAAFWITHKRVQEQDDVSTVRYVAAYLWMVFLLALVGGSFGTLLFSVVRAIYRSSDAATGWAVLLLLLGLPACGLIGIFIALPLIARASRMFWPRAESAARNRAGVVQAP